MSSMMISTRGKGIVLSVALSALMLGGAFWLSEPYKTPVATADAAEELLRAYAIQDTDGDGLFDWQEELYGTDPQNPRSFDTSMTDYEAVMRGLIEPRFAADQDAFPSDEILPGIATGKDTLTSRFSREFFQDYLTRSAEGSIPTEDDLLAFVDGWLARIDVLADMAPKAPFSPVTSPAVSVFDYAAEVERVLLSHSVPEDATDTLSVIDAFLSENDASAQQHLVRIASWHANTAEDLKRVIVPLEQRVAHSMLVDGMTRLSIIVTLIAEFENDPLAATSAIGAYLPALETTTSAFEMIATALVVQGGLGEGAPGSLILRLVQGTSTP